MSPLEQEEAVSAEAGASTGARETTGLATAVASRVVSDTVAEVVFADSSLQYCPTCQTDGKPLADRRLSKLLK